MYGIDCAFEGKLGRDPDIKMVKNGTSPMMNLSIAVSEAKGKDGEYPKSTWISVKLFDRSITPAAEALKKGDTVYCTGRLSLDSWTDQQGQPRTGLSCFASVVQPLGQIGHRRPQQSSQDGQQKQALEPREATPPPQPPYAHSSSRPRNDIDDEIPF